VPDIFDELNEDMRAERARMLAKRYGWLGGVALLLVLGGVGGWQGMKWHRQQQDAAAAATFLTAMQAADALPPGATPTRATVAADFAKIAASAPEGYRTLARLREAALQWDAGDKEAAFKLWDTVGSDTAADPLLQQLAALLWAQHAVDSGDPASITARTAKLETPGNPYRPLAEEVDADLALRQDNKEKATGLLRAVMTDPMAAEALRNRAGALLTLLGAPPEARG
jgi:hypothetical protein